MVFVDFTADWCLTCKVNEVGTLSDHRVVSAFQKADVITLRADWTRRDPEITRALAEQHRVGTPLFLLYSAHSYQPKILPQILTTNIVLNALRNGGAGVCVKKKRRLLRWSSAARSCRKTTFSSSCHIDQLTRSGTRCGLDITGSGITIGVAIGIFGATFDRTGLVCLSNRVDRID